MNDHVYGGFVPGVAAGIPAAPYAVDRPGPRQPTAPNHVHGSPAEPLWPQAPRPAVRMPVRGPLAADAYADAFLNGRPHPYAVPRFPLPPNPGRPRSSHRVPGRGGWPG